MERQVLGLYRKLAASNRTASVQFPGTPFFVSPPWAGDYSPDADRTRDSGRVKRPSIDWSSERSDVFQEESYGF